MCLLRQDLPIKLYSLLTLRSPHIWVLGISTPVQMVNRQDVPQTKSTFISVLHVFSILCENMDLHMQAQCTPPCS